MSVEMEFILPDINRILALNTWYELVLAQEQIDQ